MWQKIKPENILMFKTDSSVYICGCIEKERETEGGRKEGRTEGW